MVYPVVWNSSSPKYWFNATVLVIVVQVDEKKTIHIFFNHTLWIMYCFECFSTVKAGRQKKPALALLLLLTILAFTERKYCRCWCVYVCVRAVFIVYFVRFILLYNMMKEQTGANIKGNNDNCNQLCYMYLYCVLYCIQNIVQIYTRLSYCCRLVVWMYVCLVVCV